MLYPSEFGFNPTYPHARDFEVININDSVGKGVITYRGFKQGELLASIAGRIVPEVLQHTLEIDESTHNHDPYFSGYFLHSCEPNVFVDMKAMVVTALKDIAEHSLLYMDYTSTESRLFKQFPCSCSSISCRGWITGNKEVHPEIMSFDNYVR